jgi:hypothetical protein
MYHDAYRDTGDFGGDIHRAMDEVGSILDEQGTKVTRSGKVWAEKMPDPAPRMPEHRIYAEREVKVYPAGVSGKDNPAPIRTELRSVPVKCIPQPTLLPGEAPKSNSAFDRALVSAKQTVTRSRPTQGGTCPFAGTLSMLWYGIKAEAKRRKMDLDENQLDDTLRMIQKAIPEANQASYPLFQHFMSRITGGESFHAAMDCLQVDFTAAATEMHALRDFTNEREVQLEEVSRSLGVRPDELISCDIEGNVIGGRGAFLTDQGRWTTDDDDEGQNGELYADRHSPQQMDDALEEQVRRDAFNRISTGAGDPDQQLIFDPRYLIKKPVDREFTVDVPTYTLHFWPKGQDPTEENMQRFECAGFWGDIKRDVISAFPKEEWDMDVERGDKTPISTTEPVYRRPSWHLGCTNTHCDGRKYFFDGSAADEMTELAGLAAKPDDWQYDEDRKMREYKKETEERIGMPLAEFLDFGARQEQCPKCREHMMYVNPQKTIYVDGDKIRVPEMTICRNHGWWVKPHVENDFDRLVKFYGGDKVKAAERMDTLTLHDGVVYAEQFGDTTYTWQLDWLQRPEQMEVRKVKRLMPDQDLSNLELFNEIRQGIMNNFTKKQRRFLIDQLYNQRARQQWEQVEKSEFVDALRRKLSHVTMDTFHEAYGLVARILMTNSKLSFPEKNYAWALLNGLKSAFQLDAETAILKGEDCAEYTRWIEGLKLISFRHLTVVNERCNSLKLRHESVFLIKEAVKVARRRLAALARTTSWIEAQENYLYSVEAGDVRADQDRIDDIMAASTLAKSANHLANRVKEVLR